MTYSLSSINTCLLPNFQAWTDEYGMMTNNPNGESTDNGNLFTAHYTYGLVSTNQINDEEKQRILQVYKNNFLQPGILCRTPNFPGNRQAQDDMYGLFSAEALLNPNNREMTRSIYEYGKMSAHGVDPTEPYQTAQRIASIGIKILTLGRSRWIWNNINPGTFDEASWLGRFPAFLAVMQMSIKEQVNPIDWVYWAVSSLYSAWFGDSSGNNGDCLMLHGAIAVQGYGKISDWVCRQIHNGIKRKYGSAGGLMLAYFADPTNPLVNLLKNTD